MKPWRILARRQLLDGRPWLRLWVDDVQLPDGRVVEDFYTIEMPDFVVVVAVTPEGRVVTERSYRHGPGRICLNMPAGYIAEGETPLGAARRELLEETGFEARTWASLGSFTNDGNRGCGVGHLFLAEGAERVRDPDSGDLEEMEIELMSLEELCETVRRGEVAVVSSAATIALAALQKAGDGKAESSLYGRAF